MKKHNDSKAHLEILKLQKKAQKETIAGDFNKEEAMFDENTSCVFLIANFLAKKVCPFSDQSIY